MFSEMLNRLHRQVLELVVNVKPHRVHGRRELTLDPLLEDIVMCMPEVIMIEGQPHIAGVRIYFEA